MCRRCRCRREDVAAAGGPFCAECAAATRVCALCGPRPLTTFTSRYSRGEVCDACWIARAERGCARLAAEYEALLAEGPAADPREQLRRERALAKYSGGYLAHVRAGREADRRRRRAARRGASPSLDAVYLRDGGVCWLCREAVERVQASRDHVVPIIAGGLDVFENVRLAHLRCNSARGARVEWPAGQVSSG